MEPDKVGSMLRQPLFYERMVVFLSLGGKVNITYQHI